MLRSACTCGTIYREDYEKSKEPEKKDEAIHVVLRPRRHVVFDESVIDNEFAGKKSSKSK